MSCDCPPDACLCGLAEAIDQSNAAKRERQQALREEVEHLRGMLADTYNAWAYGRGLPTKRLFEIEREVGSWHRKLA